MGTMISTTVVLPCHNTADLLHEQLAALARQDGTSGFEVVVVDDGSSEDVAQVVERFRGPLPHLRYVRLPYRMGAAHARNTGVESAGSDRILFCDADDVVHEAWVARLSAALEHHHVVAGPLELHRLNPPWLATSGILEQTSGLQHGDFLPLAGGGNLGVRRAAFAAIGGFDTRLPSLEDTDLCFRLQLAGYPLHFVPEAVVHVRMRQSLGDLFRQGRRWGHATVALHRKHLGVGMPRPKWARNLGGWLLVIPRLLVAWNRSRLCRWVFGLGWRVGRLQGSRDYRLLTF